MQFSFFPPIFRQPENTSPKASVSEDSLLNGEIDVESVTPPRPSVAKKLGKGTKRRSGGTPVYTCDSSGDARLQEQLDMKQHLQV